MHQSHALRGKSRPDTDRPDERILAAACELFCRDGIHATGIDLILNEANAAKMSLYKHFGSKEGLVEAVLEQEGEAWRGWFRQSIEKIGKNPKKRLLGIFDVLQQWLSQDNYTGCAFINAVAEYSKGDERIRAIALSHKQQVLATIAGLIDDCGCADADELLHELALLMDGAIVAAMVTGDATMAKHAARAAKILVQARMK